MMLTNIVAIAAILAGALVVMAPSRFWSVRYVCSDIGLFLASIAAYYGYTVVMERRRKSMSVPCKEVEAKIVQPETDSKPQFDVDEHVALLQKYSAERNIGRTMRTFRSIQQNTSCVSSQVYNVVLQAFINCGNVDGAEDWMDTIVEAQKADEASFNILIKGLVEVHALEKARDLVDQMKKAGIHPSSAVFDNILAGCARAKRFTESLSLLEEMHAAGVQPTSSTLHTIEKLLDDSRNIDQSLCRIRQIMSKFQIEAKMLADLPRLAAVISQATDSMLAPCAHELHIAGSLPQIKAVQRTLKQHGFLDSTEKDARPFDGHWETDDGLTVIIEGKVVRWGGQHASRLRFTGEDQRCCMLTLYGKPTKGVSSPAIEAQDTKQLRWDNGETWHSYDGRAIGQDVLFSQSMTKPSRDQAQDEAQRARSSAMLKCVSKNALGLPMILEDAITQFLGGELFYVRVQFQSKWNPSRPSDDDELPLLQDADADICSSLSHRHPWVGLRHCWAEPGADQCGQRTLVNGEEVDEDCFRRQVKALRWS